MYSCLLLTFLTEKHQKQKARERLHSDSPSSKYKQYNYGEKDNSEERSKNRNRRKSKHIYEQSREFDSYSNKTEDAVVDKKSRRRQSRRSGVKTDKCDEKRKNTNDCNTKDNH